MNSMILLSRTLTHLIFLMKLLEVRMNKLLKTYRIFKVNLLLLKILQWYKLWNNSKLKLKMPMFSSMREKTWLIWKSLMSIWMTLMLVQIKLRWTIDMNSANFPKFKMLKSKFHQLFMIISLKKIKNSG
jgi:hypothetical protein